MRFQLQPYKKSRQSCLTLRIETADKLTDGILTKDDKELEKGQEEYEKAVTKYENSKSRGERLNVRQAARKATKTRKQQAISVTPRKKTIVRKT